MKVTGVETYLLSAPLPQPVRTSTHVISRVSEVVGLELRPETLEKYGVRLG